MNFWEFCDKHSTEIMHGLGVIGTIIAWLTVMAFIVYGEEIGRFFSVWLERRHELKLEREKKRK